MDLWHVAHGADLPNGAIIEPGRYGRQVRAQGQHHPHYEREMLLEDWRLTRTTIAVSRLDCSYAWDDLPAAEHWAADDPEYPGIVYRVVPTDPDAAHLRLDTLWITWLREWLEQDPTTRDTQVRDDRLAGYWSATSTADKAPHSQPAWEWYSIDPVS